MTGISREAMERAKHLARIGAQVEWDAESVNLQRAYASLVKEVLAAWLAGEPSGPWVTRFNGVEWSVFNKADPTSEWSEEQVKAICNALNFLSALAAPTGDTR